MLSHLKIIVDDSAWEINYLRLEAASYTYYTGNMKYETFHSPSQPPEVGKSSIKTFHLLKHQHNFNIFFQDILYSSMLT